MAGHGVGGGVGGGAWPWDLLKPSCPRPGDVALWRFQRLLVAELQRGFFDKHVWLSMWDRPPRSRFTRVQRATCCILLICLFLGANAVWYGAVGDATYRWVLWGSARPPSAQPPIPPAPPPKPAPSLLSCHSMGPASSLIPLSIDIIAVGLVSSLVVYPVYLAILFLFRMSRSKVGGAPGAWARLPLPRAVLLSMAAREGSGARGEMQGVRIRSEQGSLLTPLKQTGLAGEPADAHVS